MNPSLQEHFSLGARVRVCKRPGPASRRGRAFTLVELLVVIAVIVAILAFTVPALNGLKNSGEVSKTVYDLTGILDQSRTYAMANNTYVYVGFGEADATTSTSGKQDFSDGKVGRVSVAVVASKDGTPGYDVNNPAVSGTWDTNGKNLAIIGRVQTFTNIHLVNLGQRPSSGSMSRPPYANTSEVDSKYNLGSSDCRAATVFSFPPGISPAAANYTFVKVIQFDPQGTARIQRDDNAGNIPPLIEIGLEPARGNVAPPLPSPATTGSIAAIQIDGMMGTTRIYRP